MTSRLTIDPVAGCAFFRDRSLFVCTLLPPDREHPERWSTLAFATDGLATYDEALDLARSLAGRHFSVLVERITLGTEAWPDVEPTQAADYLVERDGFVVLAPSITGWVAMPPARPHHVVRLVAATPADGEATARAALAALATCGLVARVRAVFAGDSGAEIDAVSSGPGGQRGGGFATSVAAEDPSPTARSSVAASDDSASPRVAVAPIERSDRAVALNAAVAVYVRASPDRRGLATVLQQYGWTAEGDEIQSTLDALIATTTDYLWAQQPGVRWSAGFEAELFEHVAARHTWLAPAALPTVLAYARWLCWHEGLEIT